MVLTIKGATLQQFGNVLFWMIQPPPFVSQEKSGVPSSVYPLSHVTDTCRPSSEMLNVPASGKSGGSQTKMFYKIIYASKQQVLIPSFKQFIYGTTQIPNNT